MPSAWLCLLAACLALVIASLAPAGSSALGPFGAMAAEPETPNEDEKGEPGPQRTGLPLPRFASLASNKVNVRRGPGKIYPVDWVFVRKGMPVEITAEWELWRRIRDSDGTTGWVHKSMLGGTRMAVVLGDTRALYRKPDPGSGIMARAEAGVIAKLQSCHGDWCRLDVGVTRGWLQKSEFFGAYPAEEID
jgi:SH3-like domain-containing protein